MGVGNSKNNPTIEQKEKKKSINSKIIWIDYNIDNEENTKYKEELLENYTLIECKLINQGLDEIKKLKFEKVILILSKTTFNEFIPLFEKEKIKICCSLNIIVFTKKDGLTLVEDICKKNKEISSGYLFDRTNIFYNFEQVKDFIEKEKTRKITFSPHFEVIDNVNKIYYDKKMECFEKIENYEELILPIYFHKLIETITIEEIHNFNYYLCSFEEARKLISQLENIPEMPVEIICKYWAKIYTLEKGKFYAVLNHGLREKKFKLFLPFVKMMYEGVKKRCSHQ